MRNYVVVLFMIIAMPLLGQNFVDCPQYMVMDTLFTQTRVVRDFYFNMNNDSTSLNRHIGPVDYSILAKVGSATDTLTVEAYGITRKLLTGLTNYRTEYADSVRVATISLTTAYAFNTYPIDPLFVNFRVYDGIRIVLKKGGSDDDEDTSYHNIRIWPQGNQR